MSTDSAPESISRRSRWFAGSRTYITLIPLFILILIPVGLVIAIAKWDILENFPFQNFPKEILCFNTELIAIAALAGFLGSFVRVFNSALAGELRAFSIATRFMTAFLRPLTGAILGLFTLAVFGSGLIAMPTGDPTNGAIGGVSKEAAFVFAAAFVAGLVDDFVLSLANQLIERFGMRSNERKEEGVAGD